MFSHQILDVFDFGPEMVTNPRDCAGKKELVWGPLVVKEGRLLEKERLAELFFAEEVSGGLWEGLLLMLVVVAN